MLSVPWHAGAGNYGRRPIGPETDRARSLDRICPQALRTNAVLHRQSGFGCRAGRHTGLSRYNSRAHAREEYSPAESVMAVIKRDLSVIVPTLEYPYVDAAVAGLMKQSAPAGCYEVVVADSREGRWADAIQEEAQRNPAIPVVYVRSESQGL